MSQEQWGLWYTLAECLIVIGGEHTSLIVLMVYRFVCLGNSNTSLLMIQSIGCLSISKLDGRQVTAVFIIRRQTRLSQYFP